VFERLSWKRRAEIAEAELIVTKALLETALGQITAFETRLNERAVLINMERKGRVNRFTFVRNNVMTVIETFGTWDDDFDGWKTALLGPVIE
jgi:hypothetical protein